MRSQILDFCSVLRRHFEFDYVDKSYLQPNHRYMSCRILLVEDEALIAADLQLMLSDLGHNVVGVIDHGLGAIRLAQTLIPEIIFMDVNLKGNLNGIETALLIDGILGKVSFIFISAIRLQDYEPAKLPRKYVGLQKPFIEGYIEDAIRRSHSST
jgi:two-component system, LytTR family, response regulator